MALTMSALFTLSAITTLTLAWFKKANLIRWSILGSLIPIIPIIILLTKSRNRDFDYEKESTTFLWAAVIMVVFAMGLSYLVNKQNLTQLSSSGGGSYSTTMTQYSDGSIGFSNSSYNSGGGGYGEPEVVEPLFIILIIAWALFFTFSSDWNWSDKQLPFVFALLFLWIPCNWMYYFTDILWGRLMLQAILMIVSLIAFIRSVLTFLPR